MAYPFLRRFILPHLLQTIGSVRGQEHLPTSGPFILTPNHVSYIEPPLIGMVVVFSANRKLYSVTKYTVWRNAHFLHLDDWLGMMPVRPDDRGAVLAIAQEHLERGEPVMIFPEGKRNIGPELARGRTGAARLALRTGAPVVPAGYVGPEGLSLRQTFTNALFHRREVRIAFGASLHFPKLPEDQITHEQLTDVTRRILCAVGELCNKRYPF